MPQSKVKEKNINNIRHKREKPVYDEQSIPYRLANYQLEHIKKFKPDVKEPNLQKWADDIRLLIEIDKREPKEIGQVIEWVTTDSFWQGVIFSSANLRKNWDKVTAAKKKSENTFKPSNRAVVTQPITLSEKEGARMDEIYKKRNERAGLSPAAND